MGALITRNQSTTAIKWNYTLSLKPKKWVLIEIKFTKKPSEFITLSDALIKRLVVKRFVVRYYFVDIILL